MSTCFLPFTLDPQGWIFPALHRHSPNFNERPVDTVIDLLVIHNISLPAGEFGCDYVGQLFCNTLDCSVHETFADLQGLQVSSHLFINRQGELTQFVSLFDRAWHAGVSHFAGRDNCNDFSIGIELEGTDTLSYTMEQYRTLSQLTKVLMASFPQISKDRIVGHNTIAPGRKTDPGESFDWSFFLSSLD